MPARCAPPFKEPQGPTTHITDSGPPLHGPLINDPGPRTPLDLVTRIPPHSIDDLICKDDADQGRVPGPTIDPRTGHEVGRFIADDQGNIMIEPVGGGTKPAGPGGVDTHTTYPNGSNYQRYNPQGHKNNPTPHAHGHLQGTGPNMKGQGDSLDPEGNVVPWNSPDAHWPIKK